ncbi:hypothetical protein L6255_04420 [Candidatus Parcubacteria bacterium]|nr:hypothetical protein [Patescibacteria group bacterium]MCG2689652.1 hypothetical protein [Candidatus Parcubacteria bacterium]
MSDLTQVAKEFNELVEEADKSRLAFSATALTIYTALSSGLFLLSTNLKFNDCTEKTSFFVVAVTSMLIVLLSLIERYAYFLIADNKGKLYTNKIRETSMPYEGQLGGTAFQTKLVSFLIHAILVLIIINLFASIVFVYFKLYTT